MQSDGREAGESRLTCLMRRHGDVVLRCCLLLCGDPGAARVCARRTFVQAYEAPETPGYSELARLLRIALRECPAPSRVPRESRSMAGRFWALRPPLRRAAALHLYAGLSVPETAWAMDTSSRHAQRLIERARQGLV